jgi:hypothetical protein
MHFLKLNSPTKAFLLLCLLVAPWQLAVSYELNLVMGEDILINYRAIDLYTQKEPYNGKGPNQPSDAFAPQDEVILYAYVTYRGDPVPGKIVAFEAHGPLNRYENLSFITTAVTDDEGIATTSFRIPWPNGHPKEAVFGVWNVIAVVDIAEVSVNDTLSFQVGWIIELIKVETVDIYNFSKYAFMKGEDMHFRLTVKNIAMTDKKATLILDVYDNLSISFGQIVLPDEQISPGVTTLFIKDLLIPETASLGEGTVYANAFTALPSLGGIPWCPQVSTTFSIVKLIHDVAVINVFPSVYEALPCQTINVLVVVKNEGSVRETFDVSAYYDSTLIGTLIVKELAPRTEKIVVFKWCTCCMKPGNYTLSAEASVVPGEVDIEDNKFVDGVVQIKALPPTEYAPRWLLAFLFVIAVLIGAVLFILVGFILWWRRKKKKEEAKPPPPLVVSKPYPELSLKATKKCGVCGKEFPAVYTFCPHCMSFHGKDYE